MQQAAKPDFKHLVKTEINYDSLLILVRSIDSG